MKCTNNISFNFNITGNPTLKKTISCLPCLGYILSIIQQNSLKEQISHQTSNEDLIKLIKEKNEYKVAATVGNLIAVGLVITGLALGIITGGLPLTCGICGTIGLSAMAGKDVYDIKRNNTIIEEVQSNGQKPAEAMIH